MRRLRAWISRIPGLFSKAWRERELAAELESHLQMHIEDNLRSGMTLPQARRDAILKLGGLESTKFAYRERNTIPVVDNLLQDTRFAIRQLRKNPGFTSTAILMLALGICSSAALFAFVDAALIKPLPYRDANRLVTVKERNASFQLANQRANLSYLDYLDWKKMNTVFQSLDVYDGTGFLLEGPNGPEPVRAARVSAGFFRTLGVTPVLGRDFYDGEDSPGAPKSVMLTYATWQARFGGRKDLIGQTLTLSDSPYTIAGILPRDFHFAPRGAAEFWVPAQPSGNCDTRRSCHNLDGLARLKDGVSAQAALAELVVIAQRLEKQYPDSNRGRSALVEPLSEVIVGNVRPILLTLLGGAGLLLLIACVNVASLLLVRAESRKREMSVRSSLGASPSRLISQFATESLVLVITGTVLGLASARWTMQLLLALVPANLMAGMPFLRDLGLNSRVLGFVGLISALAAVVFSITPALRLPLSRVREGMAEGSRGSAGNTWHRLGSRLVVLELATAMVLLVGAGLLGKSFYRLLHVDLGFDPDHLATLTVLAPDYSYGKNEKAAALGREVVARISELPGVESAGIANALPVSGSGYTTWIRIVGQPYHGEINDVNEREVSSNLFTTLHTKLLRGRLFTEVDEASKPLVAIINQKLARVYFPGEDPIGRVIGDNTLSAGSLREVVGVIDDVKEGALDSEIYPAIYYPFNQSPEDYFSVVARTSQAEDSLLPALRAAIHRIDPSIGTIEEAAMLDRIRDSPTAYLHRSSAWLVGGFAALALLLGVVGLYGVVAYTVSQRTREIGVRMALGARRSTVFALILKEAGWLTIAGIVIGLGCSIAGAVLMRKLLFGTPPWDVPTLAAVAGVLGVAALLASYIPARRAASVSPMDALRVD